MVNNFGPLQFRYKQVSLQRGSEKHLRVTDVTSWCTDGLHNIANTSGTVYRTGAEISKPTT